ncbi:hypothetical protein [Streptomyces sp. H27-D2]|uniref:hypothetical protein n=1 Tax=Streptomyces sp. H27-D2 TaxID=3046304 RepID=UPI002DB9AAFE|nr:hypothetical protein [Streptomyces sp. H27-D2]MEC4015398.1 hypothetical protein [Streptomyces sp. H27-D2]
MKRRMWLLGSALACPLLLVSCTLVQEPRPDDAASSASRGATPSPRQVEKTLAAEARTAVDGTAAGEKLVESGEERVTDGAHTRPFRHREKGQYRLTIACAGHGDAEVAFTPALDVAKKTLPCDGTVTSQRFVVRQALRLDITGSEGSSGMIAWRISQM